MMKYCLAIAIFIFAGCVTGVRPIKDAAYKNDRPERVYLSSEPRYELVVKEEPKTNSVTVGLVDVKGNLITNVNFLIIKPAKLERIRIKGDIDFKNGSFWGEVIENHIITIVVMCILFTLLGWKNVKNFIIEAFRKL